MNQTSFCIEANKQTKMFNLLFQMAGLQNNFSSAPAFDLVAPFFFFFSFFATCHGINRSMLMNSGFNGPKQAKAFWVAA